MRYSVSRVGTFDKCPYNFKLRYLDEIKVVEAYAPGDARIVGKAVHMAAETDLKTMVQYYYGEYPIGSDAHENEVIRLEHLAAKLKAAVIDFNILHMEYEIKTPEFLGYVDLIVQNEDGTVGVYDYKYSNNKSYYLESVQLHVYKHYLELQGFKVRDLGFIFVPKTGIYQKKTEDLNQFRTRLKQTLEKMQVEIIPVKYDPEKVDEYFASVAAIEAAKEYPKCESNLCRFCDYEKYCKEGLEYMNLPQAERRVINAVNKKVVWIYGSPFSGKTTFANKFPMPLMLNSDGNIKFVDAQFVSIKNEVKQAGRVVNTTLAWQILKDTVDELEKNPECGFKTIVVDLLEDMYQHCRLFIYEREGIEHESDNGFKAWDLVEQEFLNLIKRLTNLDYENIVLISHEDISKDITKRSGDKVTRIAPNIREKIALKIAGMVDVVGRAVCEGEEYTLSFKKSEVVFGGGRITLGVDKIPLCIDALNDVYDAYINTLSVTPGETKDATEAKPGAKKATKKADKAKAEEVAAEVAPTEQQPEPAAEEVKPKRTRKKKAE